MKKKQKIDLSNIKRIIEDNRNITILLLTFMLLRAFFIFSRYHLAGWDESVYIGMGKYLYSGGTIGLWESIRPLGLPLITGLFWTLGLNTILFGEITITIFALFSILLTYILGTKLFGKDVGFIAALLLAFSPVFFYQSGIIMTEIPTLFFLLLCVIFYINKRYFWSGMFAAFATMFRFPAGLIFAALVIDLALRIYTHKEKMPAFLQRSKSFIQKGVSLSIGFATVIFAFVIYNYFRYRAYTKNAFDAMLRPFILGSMHASNIFESVSTATFFGKLHNIFFYILTLLDNNIVLILSILGIIFLIQKIIRSRKYENTIIMMIITGLFLIYLTYIINKQQRFILIILPFIALLSAYALMRIDHSLLKNKRKAAASWLWTIVIISLVYSAFAGLHYYTWQTPSDQPAAIVDEYYRYFDENNITGPVLTTDPVFAAYSNNRFIPYYDTVTQVKYLNPWEIDENVVAIVYTNYSIPCMPGDKACESNRQLLLDELFVSKKLAYNYTDSYAERYIFLNK